MTSSSDKFLWSSGGVSWGPGGKCMDNDFFIVSILWDHRIAKCLLASRTSHRRECFAWSCLIPPWTWRQPCPMWTSRLWMWWSCRGSVECDFWRHGCRTASPWSTGGTRGTLPPWHIGAPSCICRSISRGVHWKTTRTQTSFHRWDRCRYKHWSLSLSKICEVSCLWGRGACMPWYF